MGLNPLGRNWGPIVNWDSLGKAYASIIIVWTVLLLSGITWLIINRRLHFIRMRNLPVAILSTVLLWVYLFKIFMAYTTNGHFTCRAEYWIMNIYLPFGIALFQANVLQLRSVSKQQTKLLSSQSSFASSETLKGVRSVMGRWRNMTDAQKGYVFIGFGMVLQIIITAAVYSTDPVLQGDWSSFGHIPFNKGQAKCRKSVAWVPSAFWQLFWAWIYGPYLLFTVRHIRDVHRWWLQTTLSVVAALPGTPLWLAALFSTAFKPVNKWFVPPMWLAPGIMVMQFVTIFFPIFECFENRASLYRSPYLLDTSESEESPSESTGESMGESMGSEKTFVPSTTARLFDVLRDEVSATGKDLYRMTALEKALVINPAPLLVFAATKDFTAENIIFLIHVRDWRQAWKGAPRREGTSKLTPRVKIELFKAAVDIHFGSVCERTADFPINVESHIRNALDAAFKPYQSVYDHKGRGRFSGSPVEITPPQFTAMGESADIEKSAEWWAQAWVDGKGIEAMVTSLSESEPAAPGTPEHAKEAARERAAARIPELDEHVFDAAEASIKYLVLTNTWRKFVTSSRDNH